MYLQTPRPFLSLHPSPSQASAPSSLVRLASARSLCLPCNCPTAADWRVDCSKFTDAYILISCRCVYMSVSLHRIFTFIRRHRSVAGLTRERQRTLVWEKHFWVSLSIYPQLRLRLRWVEDRKNVHVALKQMQHLFSFGLSALVTSPRSL